jgi:hypothetical protein
MGQAQPARIAVDGVLQIAKFDQSATYQSRQMINRALVSLFGYANPVGANNQEKA